MAQEITSFADILAPVTPEEFFAAHYGKKALHVPGTADKFASVMSWARLNDILNMTGIWSGGSLQLVLDREIVPPQEYCRRGADRSSGGEILQPDPARVTALIRRGASVVANDIDSLNPGLAATANTLEVALEAKVQANLYCSWQMHQAFDSHFDTHDVYAIHVEGEKTWRIYEGRLENPVAHPAFKTLGQPYHDKARGKVKTEVTMRPGDLLYIPRGVYHDAVALTEGTIHIAFGATAVIGLDFLTAMFERAIQDPLARANMPRLAGPGGEAAFDEHLAKLARRFGEIGGEAELMAEFKEFQRHYKYSRGGYDLPGEAAAASYRVTAKGVKIAEEGNGFVLKGSGGTVPIPPGQDRWVAWVIKRDQFTRAEFDAAFPETPESERAQLLRDLASMKIIATF
jgi:ribosomal protein L16 Arg81 hydroxylase